MEIIFNTSDPVIIIVYTLIISAIIYIGRKTEKAFIPALLMVYVLFLLIYHSTTNAVTDFAIRAKYISIAFDLIFLLLSFISFLWIDDINAKKKNLRNYDNSLSWFWDDL